MFQKKLDFGYMWKLFPFWTRTECDVKMWYFVHIYHNPKDEWGSLYYFVSIHMYSINDFLYSPNVSRL